MIGKEPAWSPVKTSTLTVMRESIKKMHRNLT